MEELRWDEDKILRYGLIGMGAVLVLVLALLVHGLVTRSKTPPGVTLAVVALSPQAARSLPGLLKAYTAADRVPVSVQTWPAAPQALGMKLATTLAAGVAPDVFVLAPAEVEMLGAAPAGGGPPILRDLTGVARALGLPPAALAPYEVKGHALALPLAGGVGVAVLTASHHPGQALALAKFLAERLHP